MADPTIVLVPDLRNCAGRESAHSRLADTPVMGGPAGR
jgi:hypothetical protein